MAAEDVSTRHCPRCKTHKPALEFRRKSNGRIASYCRPCEKDYHREHYQANKAAYVAKANQWRMDNPERYRANNKSYYESIKDAHIAYSREWCKRNPERRKEIWTRYRERNLDRARANEQAYRERNRAACNARINEWKAQNRPLLTEYSRRRQAAMLRAVPPWADLEAIRAFYYEAARLSEESGKKHHVDHIVPLLGRTVCGLHCEANLQVLEGVENLRKNNHRWPDMP